MKRRDSSTFPERTSRNRIRLARWIGFLPLALLGGISAGFLVDLMNRIAIADYQDPHSLLIRLYISGIPGLAAGAAGVYIACVIAPAQPNRVAVAITGMALFLPLFSILPAPVPRPTIPLFFALLVVLGSWGMTFTIRSGEILPGRIPRIR